jgi:hypothetical protein
MKKYRCPWYMSTKNYYILCFLPLPGINLGNKGNSLWKASDGLVWSGFELSVCCNNGAAEGD